MSNDYTDEIPEAKAGDRASVVYYPSGHDIEVWDPEDPWHGPCDVLRSSDPLHTHVEVEAVLLANRFRVVGEWTDRDPEDPGMEFCADVEFLGFEDEG
ncbi:hypothetical protein [Nocardia camponoti]|uniref:Uncharacterized protein n=1 Tax=Nocardia camponoti TaxID=1616106 RepID=A0A917QUP8_9NOCA|nr:hypothetical protein [Nocardia camponoti]GGK69034.1 hypothetical protein GCM10011591_46440 [Nocardia camponoti]